MTHTPIDKIQVLDSIEKEIILCLQSAGNIYTINIQKKNINH